MEPSLPASEVNLLSALQSTVGPRASRCNVQAEREVPSCWVYVVSRAQVSRRFVSPEDRDSISDFKLTRRLRNRISGHVAGLRKRMELPKSKTIEDRCGRILRSGQLHLSPV